MLTGIAGYYDVSFMDFHLDYSVDTNGDKVTESAAAARLKCYGFPAGKTANQWERADKRFDLAQEPNEANR
ncbi:hypothetical protein, partial [Nocardia abscessus]|uniref:hypothetical protein n=1 Tax=Nocardia abscessus TaxID=120957 RepID=UPI0024543532